MDFGCQVERIGRLGIEDPVVVIPFAIFQLFVIGVNVLTDGSGLDEVEGGADDISEFAGGNHLSIDGRELLAADSQTMG